jgi:hypothetical protein
MQSILRKLWGVSGHEFYIIVPRWRSSDNIPRTFVGDSLAPSLLEPSRDIQCALYELSDLYKPSLYEPTMSHGDALTICLCPGDPRAAWWEEQQTRDGRLHG